jgi:hypothetical protein
VRDTDDATLAFWTRVAWRDAALSPGSRLLLLAVAFLANPAGNVTATDATMAGVMGVHTRTVRAARRNCERRGVVEIQPGANRRQGAREGLTYQLVSGAPESGASSAKRKTISHRIAEITDAVDAAKAKTIERIHKQLERMSPEDVAALERLIGKR